MPLGEGGAGEGKGSDMLPRRALTILLKRCLDVKKDIFYSWQEFVVRFIITLCVRGLKSTFLEV